MMDKARIAKAAVAELSPGSVINLGIGIPTLIPKFLESDHYYIHTENGMLGVTEVDKESIDPEIVNAGKMPVGEALGASYFGSSSSFAMIRGGHIDTAVLGALQIDEKGRIANWAVPGASILGVGGAMDLLVGAKKVIVTTSHLTSNGEPKFVEACTYPITSTRVVDIIITDKAVFKWNSDGYELVKIYSDVAIDDVIRSTGARFTISGNIEVIEVGGA